MNTARIRQAAAASLLAALVLTTVAGPAFAGKPGGGTTTSTSSLSLVMVVDKNADSLPNWNETITWKVSTTATTAPYVDVACTQNGVLVYTATAGYFATYRWPDAKNMILASPSWTGGAASCTAKLYMITTKGNKTLATTSFSVSG